MSKTYHAFTIPSDTYGWGDSKRTRPALQVKIEMSIDESRIVTKFGEKAARSKGGRSIALGGFVKIKVLSRKEIK